MATARAITPDILERLAPRFWAYVQRGETNECWEWTGSRDTAGYGRIRVGVTAYRAHRVALALSGREVPPHLFACHHCDNPPCCNPAHLFLGTVGENTRDMVRKGRKPSHVGVRNPRAKLTPEQVREIRNSPLGHKRLANQLGLGRTTIRDARSGRNWGSIA